MLRIRPSRLAASRGPRVRGLLADQAEADPQEKGPVLFAGAFPGPVFCGECGMIHGLQPGWSSW